MCGMNEASAEILSLTPSQVQAQSQHLQYFQFWFICLQSPIILIQLSTLCSQLEFLERELPFRPTKCYNAMIVYALPYQNNFLASVVQVPLQCVTCNQFCFNQFIGETKTGRSMFTTNIHFNTGNFESVGRWIETFIYNFPIHEMY